MKAVSWQTCAKEDKEHEDVVDGIDRELGVIYDIESVARALDIPLDDIDLCYYCGVMSTSDDHTVPRDFLRLLNGTVELQKFTSHKRLIVPSCKECNCLFGSLVFDTLKDKKRWMKDRLRRRYKKILGLPDWTNDELAECEPTLRKHIIIGLHKKDLIEKRIFY